MKIGERVRDMIRHWLQIQPATGQNITIRETASFDVNCMRNRVWYRGDASEIEQLFKALGQDAVGCARFWAAAPATSDVRKAHSGIPAILVDTLAYLVKSDLNDVDFESPDGAGVWPDIARDCGWEEIIGDAVSGVLAIGDGAFKISIDPHVSEYPLLEFWTGDRVDFIRRHGRITGVVFKSLYHEGGAEYELREIYEPGSIRYELWEGEKVVPLGRVPELSAYKPVHYDAAFPLAVPLCVFKSQRYPGRGRSVFDGKTDAFDAHDEVISQWIDAVRHGRVKNYIPEDMIPRDPETGKLRSVDSFGTNFIQVQNSNKENATAQIDTVQPEIRYDAFVESYAATLNMCLQGIVSPATLGIDVGKMSSAEAQREKKDITGMTRNAITDAMEKVLPQVVCSMLMTYDLMHSNQAGAYEPKVTFGEYGAPDFDSRVQTIASAATASVMSVEAQVDELWGASKDDDWKRAEVQRILTERGIEDTPEPGIVESLPAGQDTDIPGNDAV